MEDGSTLRAWLGFATEVMLLLVAIIGLIQVLIQMRKLHRGINGLVNETHDLARSTEARVAQEEVVAKEKRATGPTPPFRVRAEPWESEPPRPPTPPATP